GLACLPQRSANGRGTILSSIRGLIIERTDPPVYLHSRFGAVSRAASAATRRKQCNMPDIFISHSTWLLNPTWGSSLPGFPVAHHFLSHFGKAQTCLCKLRRLARAASSRRLHQVSR